MLRTIAGKPLAVACAVALLGVGLGGLVGASLESAWIIVLTLLYCATASISAVRLASGPHGGGAVAALLLLPPIGGFVLAVLLAMERGTP